MKAYEISYFTDEYGNLSKIVWAETAGKAKSQGVDDDELGDPLFTDINVKRVKWADDMQNLNESALLIERLKQGYSFYYDPYNDDVIMSRDTIPLIEKVGGLVKFSKLYNTGEISWNDDTEKFEEI